jgi:hypothetical protein
MFCPSKAGHTRKKPLRSLDEACNNRMERRRPHESLKRVRKHVTEDSQEASALLKTTIGGITRTLPADYARRRESLVQLFDACRMEMAGALEPALNARVALMPHETYEDKKTVANYVNAELRRFGLAIRCPRTGLACSLRADPGRRPTIGQFQLDVVNEEGRRIHPYRSVELFPLTLALDDVRRVSYGERTRSR